MARRMASAPGCSVASVTSFIARALPGVGPELVHLSLVVGHGPELRPPPAAPHLEDLHQLHVEALPESFTGHPHEQGDVVIAGEHLERFEPERPTGNLLGPGEI